MEGAYVGGVYSPPSQMTEYNRRLSLINTIKQIRGVDTLIEDIIEDAQKLDAYLLGKE